MRFLFALLIAAAPVAAVHAGTPCPVHQPGVFYPWQIQSTMPGDQWADLLIDLDATGTTGCGIAKSNLDQDTRYLACQSVLGDLHHPPLTKGGGPIAGTIPYHLVMFGPKHRDADANARHTFFRDHPNERPSCYPY